MSAKPLQPFTVGIMDYEAGDDNYRWYEVEAVDTYDACIRTIQLDDTARTLYTYDDMPMSYDEAKLVLHGERSMELWVINGHHKPYTPWPQIRECSPWGKQTEANKHLADARAAVENLEKLIQPLQRLPGILIPVELQSSFDSCRVLLAQLEQQVATATAEIDAVRSRADDAAAERQALKTAREARAKQVAQEVERQAALEKIENAKDDLTAQRQLARG